MKSALQTKKACLQIFLQSSPSPSSPSLRLATILLAVFFFFHSIPALSSSHLSSIPTISLFQLLPYQLWMSIHIVSSVVCWSSFTRNLPPPSHQTLFSGLSFKNFQGNSIYSCFASILVVLLFCKFSFLQYSLTLFIVLSFPCIFFIDFVLLLLYCLLFLLPNKKNFVTIFKSYKSFVVISIFDSVEFPLPFLFSTFYH